VPVRGKVEEVAIFSTKHRPWSVFNRVARIAECGELYVRHVCLPQIERATPAVIHWLRRKRSHQAIAEMVRAEFVEADHLGASSAALRKITSRIAAATGLSK
jgi:hypothetical protein